MGEALLSIKVCDRVHMELHGAVFAVPDPDVIECAIS